MFISNFMNTIVYLDSLAQDHQSTPQKLMAELMKNMDNVQVSGYSKNLLTIAESTTVNLNQGITIVSNQNNYFWEQLIDLKYPAFFLDLQDGTLRKLRKRYKANRFLIYYPVARKTPIIIPKFSYHYRSINYDDVHLVAQRFLTTKKQLESFDNQSDRGYLAKILNHISHDYELAKHGHLNDSVIDLFSFGYPNGVWNVIEKSIYYVDYLGQQIYLEADEHDAYKYYLGDERIGVSYPLNSHSLCRIYQHILKAVKHYALYYRSTFSINFLNDPQLKRNLAQQLKDIKRIPNIHVSLAKLIKFIQYHYHYLTKICGYFGFQTLNHDPNIWQIKLFNHRYHYWIIESPNDAERRLNNFFRANYQDMSEQVRNQVLDEISYVISGHYVAMDSILDVHDFKYNIYKVGDYDITCAVNNLIFALTKRSKIIKIANCYGNRLVQNGNLAYFISDNIHHSVVSNSLYGLELKRCIKGISKNQLTFWTWDALSSCGNLISFLNEIKRFELRIV